MKDSRPGPYARLLAHGRLAALVAISVVAGGVGGAWAVAGAPGLDRVTVMTVSDTGAATAAEQGDDSTAGESAEPEKSKAPKSEKSGRPTKAGKASSAGKPAGAGKPSKGPKAGGSGASAGSHGLHGRCVSAVATSDATGGPNDNHGGAVSAAAKACPRPTQAASAD
jgi:hypothetical protein